MEHWAQEAPADYGFHSAVWRLMKASGMMVKCGCLMGSEVQSVFLV